MEKEDVNVEVKETKHPKSKFKATASDGRIKTIQSYDSSLDSSESSQKTKNKSKTSIYLNLLGQMRFDLLTFFIVVVSEGRLSSDLSSYSCDSTNEETKREPEVWLEMLQELFAKRGVRLAKR